MGGERQSDDDDLADEGDGEEGRDANGASGSEEGSDDEEGKRIASKNPMASITDKDMIQSLLGKVGELHERIQNMEEDQARKTRMRSSTREWLAACDLKVTNTAPKL